MKNFKPLIKHIPTIAIALVVIVALIILPQVVSELTRHTHIYGEWERSIDPTCAQQGIDIRYCDCGDVQQKVIDRLDHIEGEWVVSLEDNEKKLYCSVCNRVIKTESLENHTHSWGEMQIEIEPTCTDGGLYIRTCRCGATQEYSIAPSKHVFGEWEITQEPTCTEEGLKQSVCKNCGELKEETLKTIDHKFGKWEKVQEPTCTEEGIYRTSCECGETKEESIHKTDHKFGKWTVITAPTCDKEGKEERSCECGEKESRKIEMLMHEEGKTIFYDNEKHVLCKNCDEVLEIIEIVNSQKLDIRNNTVYSLGSCDDTDIIIPSNYDNKTITIIARKAFEFTSIESVCIADSITTISEKAFYKCYSLYDVQFGSSVSVIEDKAFQHCESLTSITLPNSLERLGYCVFGNCINLDTIYYDGTISEWNSIQKDSRWDEYMTDYTIHCSDGTISK